MFFPNVLQSSQTFLEFTSFIMLKKKKVLLTTKNKNYYTGVPAVAQQ